MLQTADPHQVNTGDLCRTYGKEYVGRRNINAKMTQLCEGQQFDNNPI